MSDSDKKDPDEKPRWWHWLKKPWAITVAVATVVAIFFLNINTVLTNVRAFPSEVRKTSGQFSSWYYDDAAWRGYWTSNPQLYVDAEDMHLSAEKVVLDLDVENGVIDGTIATQQICDSMPVLDFLLVRGHVDTLGSGAMAVVWDTFGGHNQDIARLALKRDGVVMTVIPTEGFVKYFPKQARIARDTKPKENEPFCPGKMDEVVKVAEHAIRDAEAKKAEANRRPLQSGAARKSTPTN